MLFLPADTADKKYVELKKFQSAVLLQYSKSQDNRFETDPKVQHFRILTINVADLSNLKVDNA